MQDEYTTAVNKTFQDEQEIDFLKRILIIAGVEFLTYEEVMAQFPNILNESEIGFPNKEGISISPYVVTPSSTKNTWTSTRTTYVTGGVSYNLQNLVATPKNSTSPLRKTGTTVKAFSGSWQAAAGNVIQTTVLAGVGLISNTLTWLVTIYDVCSGIVTGFSKTTEVRSPNITYTYDLNTTAMFTYVRLTTQSDDYQKLCQISTKISGSISHQLVGADYKDSSGAWKSIPTRPQKFKDGGATPSGYDSSADAVKYFNGSAATFTRAISSVPIKGPGGATGITISPIYPSFPAHCE